MITQKSDRRQSAIERLRSAVAEVDPAHITVNDVVAMLELIRAAYHADSAYGAAARQEDEARAKRAAELEAAKLAAAEGIE